MWCGCCCSGGRRGAEDALEEPWIKKEGGDAPGTEESSPGTGLRMPQRPEQVSSLEPVEAPENHLARQRPLPEGLTHVVVDNGSRTIKAGLAVGGGEPSVVMASLVGRERRLSTFVGVDQSARHDIVVGNEVLSKLSLLTTTSPVHGGLIENNAGTGLRGPQGEAVRLLWRQVLEDALGHGDCAGRGQDPEEDLDLGDVCLLMTSPVVPDTNREAVLELLFEEFGVAAVQLHDPAPLELFASGRTSGIAVSCGHERCISVPILDGNIARTGIQLGSVAGLQLTTTLASQLAEKGYNSEFASAGSFYLAEAIKERAGFVHSEKLLSHDLSRASVSPLAAASEQEYTLPDGTAIELGAEVGEFGELLFNPEASDAGRELRGLGKLVVDAIEASDPGLNWDFKSTLAANVVIGGGTTALRGFDHRLANEVRALLPSKVQAQLAITPASEHRDHASFVGASVVAEFAATAPESWVLRQEYQDEGPSFAVRSFSN
mmetsp:Transcript_20795/g.60774  ORF Transcript_20795/g.60774 Transcript_20795/m.60774 type:complete len:490 (-) Transcript_20795:41-1510(-)